MRYFKMFLIQTFILINISSAQDIYQQKKNMYTLFRDNNIDLDSKSTKGWLRIFNNKEKMINYGVYFTDTEINIIVKDLRKIMKEEIIIMGVGIK